MFQGAINQLLTMGAAVKKANAITKEKEARAVEKQQKESASIAKEAAKEQAAKDKAMERMKQKVQAKWDQNKEFQAFKNSLIEDSKTKKIPEELARIAYEETKRAPKLTIGGQEVDYFSLSPEARAVVQDKLKEDK